MAAVERDGDNLNDLHLHVGSHRLYSRLDSDIAEDKKEEAEEQGEEEAEKKEGAEAEIVQTVLWRSEEQSARKSTARSGSK